MTAHTNIANKELYQSIKNSSIKFAGNTQLKIYGTLSCRSGKRIKKINRIFFASENEAIQQGYRPCAYCMRAAYLYWKTGRQATSSI